MTTLQAVEILKKFNREEETTVVELEKAIEKVVSFIENLKKPSKKRELIK